MKKIISAFICLFLFAGMLTGCGNHTEVEDDGRLKIVTTIFPVYDWVRQIAGDGNDNVEITMLMDNGVDLHNFQITADDMIRISDCDMFIYVGGESDAWVEDTLEEAANEAMVVINLMEVLGDKAKEKDVVEGMQVHEHEDEEHGDEVHEHGDAEYDEHVWLSLKNASLFCQYVSEKLSGIDVDNSTVYSRNASAYIERLKALDSEYQRTVDDAVHDTLLFGDRFPFLYMADDYGLDYYAAFSGCSAETEASFETITFLAGKADELDLSVILQIETSDGSIPNTIKDNTTAKDQRILTMNSLQSVTSSNVKDGVSYLSVMEDNLEILKEALR